MLNFKKFREHKEKLKVIFKFNSQRKTVTGN